MQFDWLTELERYSRVTDALQEMLDAWAMYAEFALYADTQDDDDGDDGEGDVTVSVEV